MMRSTSTVEMAKDVSAPSCDSSTMRTTSPPNPDGKKLLKNMPT